MEKNTWQNNDKSFNESYQWIKNRAVSILKQLFSQTALSSKEVH
jgi:hypothetical protein